MALCHRTRPGCTEMVRRFTAELRFTVTHERITFAGKPIKLAVHNPGVLHKFELAQDICANTDEVQPAICLDRIRLDRIFGRKFWPIGPATAYQAMKR